MEYQNKKIEGKKYALHRSYFKDVIRNIQDQYPDTILQIVQYKATFNELPFDYKDDDWLYQATIERQKYRGVQNSQYLTPDATAKQIAELCNNFMPEDNRVLDACCGTGQLSKYLLENELEVTGFDNDLDMVEICKLTYLEATFSKYDFKETSHWGKWELIVSNPPHEQKELTAFFNWLSITLDDEGKAILLIPKGFMNKERPKILADYLKRFDVLHKEELKESFAHTKWLCEVCILQLTDSYKMERKVNEQMQLQILPDSIESTERSNTQKTNQTNTSTNNQSWIMEKQELKKIQNVRLDKIRINPLNPRKKVNQAEITELAQSIKKVGLLQAVILRRKDDHLEIVAGECRYRAFLLNAEESIPATIGDYSDEEVMIMALAENLNRKDLSPIEEANAFDYFIRTGNYTVEDLIVKFGKSDAYIRGRLRLLSLIADFINLLDKEELSISTGIELSRYCPSIQQEVYDDHFKNDDPASWSHFKTKEVANRLVRLYTMNLSDYDFDKADCKTCTFNTDTNTLFDQFKGRCTRLECLRKKQAEYTLKICTIRTEEADFEVIVSPTEKINPQIADKLKEAGIPVKTVVNYESPELPKKPQRQDFKLECDYTEALENYKLEELGYHAELDEFEKKVEQGAYKRCLHIGEANPKICYAPVALSKATETVSELQEQDKQNKETTIKSIINGSLTLLKINELALTAFSMFEEEVYLYLMLGYLQKKYFPLFGITDTTKETLSDADKERIIQQITVEQYGFLKREFIIKSLLSINMNTPVSKIRFYIPKFTEQHFPVQIEELTRKYMDIYTKSNKKIKEKIQKAESTSQAEKQKAVTEPVPHA